MDTSKLKSLKVKPLRDTLRSLAALAQKAEVPSVGYLPVVRLDVLVGSYTGHVIDYQESSGLMTVLLLQSKEAQVIQFNVSESTVLTYLNLEQAISVVAPDSKRWSKDEGLSSLETKRLLQPVQVEIQGLIGIKLDVASELFGESGPANNVVRDVTFALAEYLRKNVTDPVALPALKQLKSITLRRSAGFRVFREADALRVDFDPEGSIPRQEQFYASIDSSL